MELNKMAPIQTLSCDAKGLGPYSGLVKTPCRCNRLNVNINNLVEGYRRCGEKKKKTLVKKKDGCASFPFLTTCWVLVNSVLQLLFALSGGKTNKHTS